MVNLLGVLFVTAAGVDAEDTAKIPHNMKKKTARANIIVVESHSLGKMTDERDRRSQSQLARSRSR